MNCVCFLAVKDAEGYHYGGTAFFVLHETREPFGPVTHTYLVTARHCVEHAYGRYGNLYVRLNLQENKTETIQVNGTWFESDTSDLAMIPFGSGLKMLDAFLPTRCFLTDELVLEKDVGIGDEIFITGLFTERLGKDKNIPILRTGIVSAMPNEKIWDQQRGRFYSAYLAEVRSFGGLSGSPVFWILQRGSMPEKPSRQFNQWIHQIMLLGVVRGHWNLTEKTGTIPEEHPALNSGIAIVTPAQELSKLIESRELDEQRRIRVAKLAKQGEPVLDSSFTRDSGEEFTRKDFEAALRKASIKLPTSKSDE